MTRTIRLVLVTLLVGAGLTVIPVPTVVWAEGLETVTRPLGLERALSVEALGILRESPLVDHAHDLIPSGVPASPPTHARQGGQAQVDAFTALGVTLDTEPYGVVSFRVREGGGWGPWRELSFSEDHAPDGEEAQSANAGVTSDPFVVGRATGYQIQVPENVGDANVHLVTITDRQVRIEVGENEAGAGTPRIHRRSEWGARGYKGVPGEADRLSMAVVHHSAGASTGSTATILRSIQAYHMDGHGWADIGYNFAVDQAGEIWEARAGGIDRAIVGAHAGGFNTGSVGVVVLGDYDSAHPTSGALTAVQQIISWKFALHHVPPGGHHIYRSVNATKFGPAATEITLPRIVGHRDVGITACPGANIYGRMGGVRTGAENATGADQPVVPAKVLAGRWNGDSREDLMMYRPGAATEDRRYYGSEVRSGGILGLGGETEPALTRGSINISGRYETVTGDFDGNEVDDVFWYAAGGGSDYVWFGVANGGLQNKAMTVNGWYEPFVGDFDGDGRSDIFWYRPAGNSFVWYGRADRTFASRSIPATDGQPAPFVGDFDGDGRDDVLFYGGGDAPDEVWYGRSQGGFSRSTGIDVKGWYRPLVGDFTGDGRDDVFWYSPGPKPDYLWSGRADRRFSSRRLAVSGTFDPLVGDFDGNGVDDIFWSRASGQDYLWSFRSGGQFESVAPSITSRFNDGTTTLSGSYLTVLDANGDGQDEIFAQEHVTGGRLWYWHKGSLRSKPVG